MKAVESIVKKLHNLFDVGLAIGTVFRTEIAPSLKAGCMLQKFTRRFRRDVDAAPAATRPEFVYVATVHSGFVGDGAIAADTDLERFSAWATKRLTNTDARPESNRVTISVFAAGPGYVFDRYAPLDEFSLFFWHERRCGLEKKDMLHYERRGGRINECGRHV